MDDHENKLASECYGYGRWDAPYWFIGLEEGKASWEGDSPTKRANAFIKLNREGLCDCLEFHKEIGEYRWHVSNPKTGRVTLQSTWKYLILLLLSFQGKPIEDKERSVLQRVYQCERWGMKDSKAGETCVIELSGLASSNLLVSAKRSKETRCEIESNLSTRIGHIRKRIRDGTPKFVVMYGLTRQKEWEAIAGITLQVGVPEKTDQTTFLLVEHPTAFSKKGQRKIPHWLASGVKLRNECNSF